METTLKPCPECNEEQCPLRGGGQLMDLIDLFKPLSEIPELDTSHFQPWTLDKLHQVEPALEEIAARAVAQNRRQLPARQAAYTDAKKSARRLVGWYARDPRLRSQGAWDCLFRYILDGLRL